MLPLHHQTYHRIQKRSVYPASSDMLRLLPSEMLITGQADCTGSQYCHSQTKVHLCYPECSEHYHSLHLQDLSVLPEAARSEQCSPYIDSAFPTSDYHLSGLLLLPLLSEAL